MVYDEDDDVVPATAAACKETEQKEEKKQEGHKKASRAIRELKGNNNKNATQLQADLTCMGRITVACVGSGECAGGCVWCTNTNGVRNP
jgi:hypothetical protein